jgi:hypothetical protein
MAWSFDIQSDPIQQRQNTLQSPRAASSRMQAYLVAHGLDLAYGVKEVGLKEGLSTRKNHCIQEPSPWFQPTQNLCPGKSGIRLGLAEVGIVAIPALPRATLAE